MEIWELCTAQKSQLCTLLAFGQTNLQASFCKDDHRSIQMVKLPVFTNVLNQIFKNRKKNVCKLFCLSLMYQRLYLH